MKFIKGVGSFVATFFATQWRQFNPLGQFLFACAIVAIVVDAGISYEYGASQTKWHAYGFALVAVALAVLPDLAITEWRKGMKGASLGVALGCVPLAFVAFQSHLGYGSAVRSSDIKEAGFSKVAYEDARKLLDAERESLGVHRAQLATLQAELKDHRARNGGWIVSIEPDALKAQVEAIDDKIRNEAARVRCAAKCEALKVQKGQILAVMDLMKREGTLTERIAATERTIERLTKEAGASKPRQSTAREQTDTFVKVIKAAMGYSMDEAIKEDEGARQFVNILTAGTGALGFMIMAPLFMIGAGLNRRIEAFQVEVPETPAAMSLPEANSAREIVTSTPPSHHVGIRKATIAQLARIAQAA